MTDNKELNWGVFMRYGKKLFAGLIIGTMIAAVLTGCGSKKESVLIYTSKEDYVVEDMNNRLREEFPDYDVTIEYMSTGNHAAKLLAEGTATECDITFNLEYGYLYQLSQAGVLADLSDYDQSVFCDDVVESTDYLIESRNGGSIILNTDLLEQKGLEEPTCYEDLLKPEYKGLISMPNPKASGTGYMFLKSLVNAWGEDTAFAYFDALTPNVLQYTSSGSGPVNALLQGEVAIGLGMTAQAVTKINEGAPLKIVFFEEGSPCSLYGMAMIEGKQDRQCVKDVFDFLVNTYIYEQNEKFFPEQIFKDTYYALDNFPQNIVYSDMSNNTVEQKETLLAKWKY